MALKVSTIGSGSWGTAVANVFADAGHQSQIWGRDPRIVDSINQSASNPHYLKGLPLHPALKATSDIREAIAAADMVVCCVPTQIIRSVFEPVKDAMANKILVNTSKGLEMGTHYRVSQIFQTLCPASAYAVLSGPSFAEEVVRRDPTAVTVASGDKAVAAMIQKAISTAYFRAYTSTDVLGVELAGSLKNVVALATGIVKGARYGFNAQSAVITRGLAEIVRAGKALGAEPATFLGLAGVGDLVLTCTGPLSRNLRAGILLGEGRPLSEAVQALGGVAEGVYTAQSAHELATRCGIEMPILKEIHSILYEGKTPAHALVTLMNRDLKEESP
jgi:glycerol-3-phosphate dehydrogenase (NAD(P)+)